MTRRAPSVLPWKEPWVDTKRTRPVARCASFTAPSTASVPEFTKNERASAAGMAAASRSISSSWGSV